MDDARPSKRIRTAAATDTPPSGGWSELLPEIAGGILSRLPSFADRARFRRVCRQWRLAAKQQEPLLAPAFPWLATSGPGVFVSIPDGAHHRLVPIPDGIIAAGAAHPRAAEAFDGWLLFRPQRGGGGYDDYCVLVNPFSKATLKLPPLCESMDKLLVVPVKSSNGADHPLVAGITYGHDLLFCRPGARSWSERRPPVGAGTGWVRDMAMHRGKLFVLYGQADLFAYDIAGVGEEEQTLPATALHCINGADTALLPPGLQDSATGRERYCYSGSLRLVVAESADGGSELLMVRRRFCTTFNVLAADLECSRWTDATSSALEGLLLFVSASCSKAVRASRYGGGGIRGGRIFITNDYSHRWVCPDHNGKYEDMDAGFGVYELSTGVFDHELLPGRACDGRCCHFPGNLFFPSFLYWSK